MFMPALLCISKIKFQTLFFLSLLPSSTEKVVGTATPNEPPEQWKYAWKFSTGDELMIGWESSSSLSSLNFWLGNEMSPESSVGWKFSFSLYNLGYLNVENILVHNLDLKPIISHR
jgi:hypothetical protein